MTTAVEPTVAAAAQSPQDSADEESLQQKRKRSPSLVNGKSHSAGDTIRDIFRALQSYDPSPSLLAFAQPQEPSSKRAKLQNGAPSGPSISSKVNSGAYHSVTDFVADVDSVATALLAATKPSSADTVDATNNWHNSQEAFDFARLSAQVDAFRRITKKIASRDAVSADQPLQSANHGRAVLTLFGNAQGHKQLFSSFQKGLPARSWKTKELHSASDLTSSVDAILPLREDALPPGITTTRIVPLSASELNKKVSTFGDLFQPRGVPPLLPPKTPRLVTARGSSVTWGNDSPSKKQSLGYTNERLPVGHWLGYNGVVVEPPPSSSHGKRKSRSRTLSTTESLIHAADAAKAVQEQAKEDALFRSVYSSFAPDQDNSNVVFPQQTKSAVWWDRFGESSYWSAFNHYPSMDNESAVEDEDVDDQDQDMADVDAADEDLELLDRQFKEAVEKYDPDAEAADTSADHPKMDKDTAEILQEISEMLETLYSYQRIRNSIIPADARGAAGSINSDASSSEPSSAELELFRTLRQQLALMVSMLPPYAVARLNGDQLEELSISRHIDLQLPDVRGVMSEDHATRIANQEAIRAANATSSRSAATPTAAGPYNPNLPRTAQPSRTTGTPSGQYYGSQTMPRNPTFGRQPLAAWQPQQSGQSQQHQRQPSYSAGTPTTAGSYGTSGSPVRQQAQSPATANMPRMAPAPPRPANPTYFPPQQNGSYTPGQYSQQAAAAASGNRVPNLQPQQSNGSQAARPPSRPGSGYQNQSQAQGQQRQYSGSPFPNPPAPAAQAQAQPQPQPGPNGNPASRSLTPADSSSQPQLQPQSQPQAQAQIQTQGQAAPAPATMAGGEVSPSS